jgi:hypothetical protein
MNDRIRYALSAVICLATLALASEWGVSESAAQGVLPRAPGASAAESGGGTGCNTIEKPASAGGASVVQQTGESLQHKNWQPAGGDIQFTVKSFVVIPPEASVIVCFRWKGTSEGKRFVEAHASRLDLDNDGKQLKLTTTVPVTLGPVPDDIITALPLVPLVPLAEVRILAIDNKKKEVVVDVSTAIGVTHPAIALGFASAIIIIGLFTLRIAADRRLKHPGILQANWFLRIISTPSGFASLSQLQIVLWTIVVAASAVYVMSLSGQLIQITNGTLVILGIAGAAGIGAQIQNASQNASVQAAAVRAAAAKNEADQTAAAKGAEATAAADPVAAARVAAENLSAARDAELKTRIAIGTKARAEALINPPTSQIPQWSDLIVTETVQDDGTVLREIDVARFQMLLFTLITAAFVLMSVVTSYVIPEISTGFQTLMGISNGVYLGSKVAQGSVVR